MRTIIGMLFVLMTALPVHAQVCKTISTATSTTAGCESGWPEEVVNYGVGTFLTEEIEIPVFFLVFLPDDGSVSVSESTLQSQISVLNGGYFDATIGKSFSFRLAGYRLIYSIDLSEIPQADGTIQSSHTGYSYDPDNALNILIGDSKTPFGGRWAQAIFPWEAASGPQTGVILPYLWLPGSGDAKFGDGEAAVHEVGHYLGLHHTYLKSATGGNVEKTSHIPDALAEGDYINDTNPHSAPMPVGGCPPTVTFDITHGTVPVENQMNYTGDACRSIFTNEQKARMSYLYEGCRPGMFTSSYLSMSDVDYSAPDQSGSATFLDHTHFVSNGGTTNINDASVLFKGSSEIQFETASGTNNRASLTIANSADLTFKAGSSITMGEWGIFDVYGVLTIEDGVHIVSVGEGAEIVKRSGGTVNYNGPDILVESEDACFLTEGTGEFSISGSDVTFQDGAFMHAKPHGTFRVEQGGSLTFGSVNSGKPNLLMEDGSKMIIGNGSSIYLNAGSTTHFADDVSMEIQSGGELVLRNGLSIPSGATLTVSGGGDLVIDSDVTLDLNNRVFLSGDTKIVVLSGATLTLEGTGTVTANRLIVVNSGGTLNIGAGLTFAMSKDVYLQARGKLNVNGTSTNPVTFDWPSQYSAISKIYLSGSGANGSVLRHVNITDAKYGIYASGVSSLSLDDVHVYSTKSGSYRVYGYNLSNTEMNNLDISGVKSRGIYLRGGSSKLTNSFLSAPATYGVYLYNASFKTGENEEPGSNEILGGTYGVWAQNSWAGLGEILPPPLSSEYGGYNRITGQTSKAVYARSGSDIVAQLNWWGSYPPPLSTFYKDATSTIDYSNALTSPPSRGAKTNPVAKGGFEPASLSGSGNDLPETGELTTGRLVKWLLDKRDNEGRWASRGAAQGLLMSGIARMDRSVQTIVTSLMLGDAVAEGDGDLAIRTGETYLNRGYLLDWERAMVAEVLFDAYLQDGQDMQKAAEMAAVVRANGDPEDADRMESLLIGAEIDITDVNKVASAKRAEDTQTGPAVAAYPNPFNPATTLQIEMETAGPVAVTIYDSLGRLITTPFDGYREAGMLTVSFDASTLPSGTYLYRVRTEAGVTTGNLLLVK